MNYQDLYKIFTNVNEMILQRDYLPMQDPINEYNFRFLYENGVANNPLMSEYKAYLKTEFKDSAYIKISNIYEHSTLTSELHATEEEIPKRCLVVFLMLDGCFSSSNLVLMENLLYQFNCMDLVIVSNMPFNPSVARDYKKRETTGNYSIQLFLYSQMKYVCTQHTLGSSYRLLSPKESQKFLEKEELIIAQLPSFCVDGPICKYYNAKCGQVIECRRSKILEGFLLEEDIFYRIVSKKVLDKKKK